MNSTPNDVCIWLLILFVLTGFFLAFVRFLKWWRKDDPDQRSVKAVRLSELLRRQP